MSIGVKARKGELVESLYQRFKKKVKEGKVFVLAMEKSYYRKPSEIRRLKNKRKKIVGDN
jgi:ribosomal protein S21